MLPDALHILGSHRVYIRGMYLIKKFIAFNICSFEFKNKSSLGREHCNTHGSDVLGQGEPAGWLWHVKGNSSSVTVKSRGIQVT